MTATTPLPNLIDETAFSAYVSALKEKRDSAIAKLIEGAVASGKLPDRAFWSMVYDFELAPMTTNASQLSMLGLHALPTLDNIPLMSDADIANALKSIVNGLGRLNIFILHADHLDDRAFLTYLVKEVLHEEVRELPPDGVAKEFIDLCMPETDAEWEQYDQLYSDNADSTHPPLPFPRPWLPRPDDNFNAPANGAVSPMTFANELSRTTSS